MAQRTRDGLRRRSTSIVAIMLVGLLLAACGPLGSDDADPTATSESLSQPTETTTDVATEATSEPETQVAENTVEQDATVEATEFPAELGTPVATAAVEGTAPSDVVSISTPNVDSGPPSASPEAVSPDSADATPMTGAAFTGGDGTSGATPPPADGTPGSLFVPVENTPESSVPSVPPDASPQASPVEEGATLAELPAALVTSCDPEIVPVIALTDVAFTTISDVNIRSGPGADCELLAISPIGEFQSVTLVGGPVTREDEDFIWVQVTAASGESGWIVTDAIEAAD